MFPASSTADWLDPQPAEQPVIPLPPRRSMGCVTITRHAWAARYLGRSGQWLAPDGTVTWDPQQALWYMDPVKLADALRATELYRTTGVTQWRLERILLQRPAGSRFYRWEVCHA